MRPAATTIDEYLSSVEWEEGRRALQALRELLHRLAPDASEAITYGVPTLKRDGSLVGFAAYKRHLTFFPFTGRTVDQFRAELEGFNTSSGAIQFTPDRPIPEDLIRRIVEARLAENAAKAAKAKERKRKAAKLGRMSGNAATPLVEVAPGVYAKLECTHATGSVKDRIARYILAKSREAGALSPGQTVVEASSGNTGIAFAYHALSLGHPVVVVMPEHMSEERKDAIRGMGAELILCSMEGSFAEAAAIRDRLAAEHGWFNPDQFSNPLNAECHRLGTGAEILYQLADKIDAFVAGVGTGGTLIGVGQALRERWPDVRIVAVEPAEAAVMTGGPNGPHGIQGIGDGFIPALASDGAEGLHPLIDSVEVVSTEEALAAARDLAVVKGWCVGVSSGANYVAAQRLRAAHAVVVTVFADGFAKYVSHGLREARECPHRASCKCSALADVLPSQRG